MTARIKYVKGPLGQAVILDGKPVGVIRKTAGDGSHTVKINGATFPNTPGSFADKLGIFPKGSPVGNFKTITEAKKAVETILYDERLFMRTGGN